MSGISFILFYLLFSLSFMFLSFWTNMWFEFRLQLIVAGKRERKYDRGLDVFWQNLSFTFFSDLFFFLSFFLISFLERSMGGLIRVKGGSHDCPFILISIYLFLTYF